MPPPNQVMLALVFAAAGIAFFVYASQIHNQPGKKAFSVFLGLMGIGMGIIFMAARLNL